MENRTYLIIAIVSSAIFIALGAILVYLYVNYIITSHKGTTLSTFVLSPAAGYSLYKFFTHHKNNKTKQKIINGVISYDYK